MRTSCMIAAALLLVGAGTAMAEDTICTPEFYYNTSEAAPLIIPIDAARMGGSLITRVDIETGDYSERLAAIDGDTIHSGKFEIINPGSHQERIDFVAVDTKTGLLIHISLIDEGLPFTHVDPDGTMSSGHCVYEYDLPK